MNKILPEKEHSTELMAFFIFNAFVYCMHMVLILISILLKKVTNPCPLKKQHKTSNIFKVYSTLDQICHNFKLLPKYFCNPLLV